MKYRFLFILMMLIALTGIAAAYDDYETLRLPALYIPAEISLPEWTINPSDDLPSDAVIYLTFAIASSFQHHLISRVTFFHKKRGRKSV